MVCFVAGWYSFFRVRVCAQVWAFPRLLQVREREMDESIGRFVQAHVACDNFGFFTFWYSFVMAMAADRIRACCLVSPTAHYFFFLPENRLRDFRHLPPGQREATVGFLTYSPSRENENPIFGVKGVDLGKLYLCLSLECCSKIPPCVDGEIKFRMFRKPTLKNRT